MRRLLSALWVVLWTAGSAAAAWPPLSEPAATAGGGSKDAALIIGVEDYLLVPDIPGALENADAWHVWLTETRQVPLERVKLLKNTAATAEEILHQARAMASKVRRGGKLWFVFIGHGAPGADRSEGVLVGVDAQRTVRGLYSRSVAQQTLIEALGSGKQKDTVMVIDACFSGRAADGQPLAKGLQPLLPVHEPEPGPSAVTIMSAGKPDQFAGALPGSERPAFSYLVLGALRGWGDQNGDGEVSAREAVGYASKVLGTLVDGRTQEPQLSGRDGLLLAKRASERGPDLAVLARELNTPTESTDTTMKDLPPSGVSGSAEPPSAGPGPWILVGSGVAAAGAGVALVLLGRSQVETAGDDKSLTAAAALSESDAGEVKQGIGWSALAVGGGLIVGGVLWLVLRSGDDAPQDSVRFGAHPHAGGWGMHATGSF